jgi:hypothetical protein
MRGYKQAFTVWERQLPQYLDRKLAKALELASK